MSGDDLSLESKPSPLHPTLLTLLPPILTTGWQSALQALKTKNAKFEDDLSKLLVANEQAQDHLQHAFTRQLLSGGVLRHTSGKHDQWRVNLASHLHMLGDDPCSVSPAALQTMLTELFSVDARPTQQHAHHKQLISTEANTVLVEVGSLALFTNTGELLAHHVELMRDRSELMYPLYATVYSQNPDLYGKQDTTSSYRQFIISTTISDTYGTEAARARPQVEQKLRIAEVVYWFKLALGNGALALLVQSKWKKSALQAWDFRVPAVLRYLAATNPSLAKVCKIAEANIWSCFDNTQGLKVPRHLKYEKYNKKQIGRASLFELLCSEFEDAAVLEDSLD
ncbi:hypothetical protein KCU95_g11109, partial [Aureobasidium melanogenum]